MRIIITGTTGTVGSEVMRQAIADADIHEAISLARKPSGIKHSKVKDIVHADFLHYNGLEHVFAEAEACLWCLGISQSRVSKEQYFTITYEYAVAAAKAMLQANPSITFLFLSGQGADSTEKSRLRFAKVKGQTENELRKMNFRSVIIFRPGGIFPVTRNSNEGTYKKLEIAFIRLMKFVAPSSVVDTDMLAKAMLKSVKSDVGSVILEHTAIKRMQKG